MISWANSGLTDTTFVLLFLWIVNVFVSLVLIHRYALKSKECEKLKSAFKLVGSDNHGAVKDYLDLQFNRTRTKKFENTDTLSHDIANLRMAYLKIESKAIEKIEEPEQFWYFLGTNLDKLLKLFGGELGVKKQQMELLNEIESSKVRVQRLVETNPDLAGREQHKRLSQNLDLIHRKIEGKNLSARQCKDYASRISSLMATYESSQLREAHVADRVKANHEQSKRKALEAIAASCDDNVATVNFVRNTHHLDKSDENVLNKLEAYEKENERLMLYVENLKTKLAEKSDTMAPDAASAANLSSNEGDYADEIIRSNEAEIDRLKHVVKNQKSVIVDLEEAVNDSKLLGSDEVAHYVVEVEQLKRATEDSEVCITMLETELEFLKSRPKNSDDDQITQEQLDVLNRELTALKDEIARMETSNELYASLLRFVFEAFSARAVEELSMLLYESITSIDYNPSVFIKARERTIDISGDEKINKKNLTIINAMQLNEFNKQRTGSVVFRMEFLSGVVSPNNGPQTDEDVRDHVVQLLKLANTAIGKVVLTQKGIASGRKFASSLSMVESASVEIDGLLERSLKKTRNSAAESFTMLKSIARSKGMDATQIAAIQSVESEILNQLKSDEVIRPKVRRAILKTIADIRGL